MLQLEDGEINDYQLNIINQWSKSDIDSFAPIYQKKFSSNPKEAKECLNTIYEYKLSFEQSKDLNLSNLHKKGIKKYFSDTKKNRTIEELIPYHKELISEMKLENYNNSKDQEIIGRINKIKKLCNEYSNKEVTKENISENLKESDDDLIAIVMNNLKKVSNITLRDAQIYSLIILLGKDKDKGRIIQIFAGEGKTLIIHCLAAILVLKGHKVDVLCVDKSIAKKDSKAAAKILESLKITVAHNIKVENDCYKKDILYGTIDVFQGGIMRDGYQLNGERQNREFDIVLLDEIECMFLDDFSQTTSLVSNKPFYERYSIYLLILWGYYKNLHLNNYDVRDNKELQEKVRIYLNEKLKNFIKIKDDKSDFFFPMSELLKDFAINQSKNWVESLIKSLSQRKNVEYAIKNDEIYKVDLLDTGLLQKDKPFDNGLQQFLQIQNELSVSPISTKTSQNTLSNYGFFQKYKNKDKNSIYGVTGAFGSVKSRELLEKLYGLDFDYIPTNNLFLLKELTSNLSKNHDTWIENILLVVKREINSGRVILLLCETVSSCEEIYEKISLNFPNYKLYKIIGEEGERNTLPKSLSKNTVIISTDMSGRGNKFDIDKEVLKNGGMHIIFTFISVNSRKEEKNYKNAGKAGEPGSYQFILDFEDTMNKYYVDYNIESHFQNYKNLLSKKEKTEEDYKTINNYNIENIKNLREERVNQRCNNALEKIPNTEKSDYLFNLYCDMVDERKDLRDTENRYCLNSIDEQWGIFLKTMDVDNQSFTTVKSKCGDFKKDIFSELNKGKVVKNPGFYNEYINDKLSSVYFYLRNKNIIAEINQNNFQEAKKYFVKNPEKEFEYDNYIEKCKAAIELDNYSFIPYYLNGICKIISGKGKGIDDLEQALIHINKEIQRYLYYFGLLISLNINIDLLFYQINILNSIKLNVIQIDIDYYYANNDKNPNFLLYKKLSKDCFLYNIKNLDDEEDEDENIEQNIEKKLFKSIKQYYINNETNGLKFLFFLRESNVFSLESLISSGIVMLGLSISGISFLDNILNVEVFNNVGNMLDIDLNCKEYEEWIKKRHEKEFPFSEDKSLMDFIKKNDIKIKNTTQDLLDIMKKYDKNYLTKINKEFGKTFKSLLRKKIEKLNLPYYKDFIGNNSQESNENNIEYALKNIENLDENKKKIILANNFMRRDGRDWLTDETREGKDINERIKNAQKELGSAADGVIIRELKESMNKEILNQRALRDKKNEELSKQKEVLAEARNRYNSLSESYKSRQSKYNERRKKNNDDIDQYNINNKLYGEDNTKFDKQKLDEDRNNIEKEQGELNKELEELNQDFEILKKEEDLVEKERLLHNSLVEESNKYNDLANVRVGLYNNLADYIKIDFTQGEIKIIFNNSNNQELPEFEKELKQLQDDANLAYKDELRRIGINIIKKEKEKIILEKRGEFEQVLLKVIKEKNNLWDNCFNQALSDVNRNFNTDDMKKIINYHLDEMKSNKGTKNEYYYMKNLENKKSIEKAETKLNKENKIIVGNVQNDNTWDSFCVVPHNNSKYFLYKSNDGNQPPKKLVNKIQEITGGYVPKINISKNEKDKEFSEVNAIENNKIMIDQIEDDKSKFVNDFENFMNFYDENRETKLEKKQKSYPEEYIKGLYNEVSRRNNSNRISIVLFNIYFLNEDRDNEIDLEFLKKLHDILINYNKIGNDEKEILKKEYNDIIDVYNNVYNVIKLKEEEELKVIEEIVKGKYKRSIKNVKPSNNTDQVNNIKPEQNTSIRPNPKENMPREYRPKQNELRPNQDEIRPELDEIKENQNKKDIDSINEGKPINGEYDNQIDNKENINTNSKDPRNSEILRLKGRNKKIGQDNNNNGKGNIDIYNPDEPREQTNDRFIEKKSQGSESKINLKENNNENDNANKIAIHSKKDEALEGSELKEENGNNGAEGGACPKMKGFCKNVGCLLF